MARTRLNMRIRDHLYGYATKNIQTPEEDKKFREAYDACVPEVTRIVEAKFPPKDMKILKKYDFGSIDDCIKLKFPNERITVFRYEKDTGPYVAKLTYQNQVYLADDTTMKVVENWEQAKEVVETAKKKIRNAYHALIYGSVYVEDITETWPEAIDHVPHKSYVPMILTPETVSLIRKNEELVKNNIDTQTKT